MDIGNFKKKYELDLIPAATEGIIIGTLVWDPLVGSPKFSHDGMPSHLFQAFFDAELMDRQAFDNWIQQCKNTPLVQAELANLVIDVELHTAAELNIPFGDFTNKFNFSNIKKYEFGAVKSKLMTFDVRIEADSLLEKMRSKSWKNYDGSVRRLFVIKELYYGTSVKITIDKKFDEEFNVKLNQYAINAKLVVDGTITKTYEFTNEEVPFAMRTTSVKNFNG